MTDDQLFGLANAVPLVGWLALVLAPLARSKLVAAARVVAVVLAAGYVIGIAAALTASGARCRILRPCPASRTPSRRRA